jgi:4-hydroxy 2-oxovalerate aldolase
MGMGRGAGNCQSELLIGFLKNPKYNVEPILAQIEDHMLKLKEEGVKWGFDIPYILTGQRNSHPRTAIAFQKENRTDYRQLRLDLLDME